MEMMLNLCRACAIFVAASGFLFGQSFFGQFEFAATLTGVFGLIAAASGLGKTSLAPMRAWIISVSSILALVGVGLDAHDYYSREHSSGSYYAWFLIGPFCVAMVFIGVHAMMQLVNNRAGVIEAPPDTSGKPDT